MQVTSVFEHKSNIPAKYTADGDDVNPPLEIKDLPEGTETLVLIVDDPDAPNGMWVHWVVWDIAVTDKIEENSVPGTEGMNDFGRTAWGGPAPPSGTHRYFFKVYALDTKLDLPPSVVKKDVEAAMEGHILDQAELVGLYSR